MSEVAADPSAGRAPAADRSPFNLITGIILVGGAVILAIRFTQGLAATTNLTHTNPWGSVDRLRRA